MLKRILLNILLNALALYGVIYLLSTDITYTGGVWFFVVGGIVMGILNSIVKPILKLITLPLQIITLGLSLIILNGVIFWIFEVIIDTIVIEGITMDVSSIKTYFFAGLLFGLINWLEHMLVHSKKS